MVPPKCVLVLHVSWPCVLTLAVSWQGDMLLKVPWLGVLHGVTAVSPGSGGAMVVCLSPQGALAACHCPEAVMIPCPYLNGSVAPCHPEGAVAECPDLWGSRCYVLFMRLSCHGVMLPKLSWPLILLPSVPWQRAEGAISVLVPMVPQPCLQVWRVPLQRVLCVSCSCVLGLGVSHLHVLVLTVLWLRVLLTRMSQQRAVVPRVPCVSLS